MIIVSQDNDKVIKRIINLDNIIYLSIDRPGKNDFVIIFKDNTMDDNELTKYNCLLGVYKTEERAKEVLQEIIKLYKATETFQVTANRISDEVGAIAIQHGFIYEMPEK